MKAVILAGGFGTRISEESDFKPKPMIEIGGKPILWHIMKIYSSFGVNEFVITLGYRGYVIKEYFSNYFLHMADVTVDLAKNDLTIHNQRAEPWRITMVETGLNTMTGGRVKRVRDYVGDETFCLTYGDGVADVDISKLVAFHKRQGLAATVTAVRPPGRFGALDMDKGLVDGFREKPLGDGSWINGGFFVLEPSVFDLIDGDSTVFEQGPLERLAQSRQLAAFEHLGFWQAMDTLRDKRTLEDLWATPKAPWRVW
jgi:glucose-1-phosphate cytidylyltransferase